MIDRLALTSWQKRILTHSHSSFTRMDWLVYLFSIFRKYLLSLWCYSCQRRCPIWYILEAVVHPNQASECSSPLSFNQFILIKEQEHQWGLGQAYFLFVCFFLLLIWHYKIGNGTLVVTRGQKWHRITLNLTNIKQLEQRFIAALVGLI